MTVFLPCCWREELPPSGGSASARASGRCSGYPASQHRGGVLIATSEHADKRNLANVEVVLDMDIAEVTKHDVSFLPFGASIVTS